MRSSERGIPSDLLCLDVMIKSYMENGGDNSALKGSMSFNNACLHVFRICSITFYIMLSLFVPLTSAVSRMCFNAFVSSALSLHLRVRTCMERLNTSTQSNRSQTPLFYHAIWLKSAKSHVNILRRLAVVWRPGNFSDILHPRSTSK